MLDGTFVFATIKEMLTVESEYKRRSMYTTAVCVESAWMEGDSCRACYYQVIAIALREL